MTIVTLLEGPKPPCSSNQPCSVRRSASQVAANARPRSNDAVTSAGLKTGSCWDSYRKLAVSVISAIVILLARSSHWRDARAPSPAESWCGLAASPPGCCRLGGLRSLHAAEARRPCRRIGYGFEAGGRPVGAEGPASRSPVRGGRAPES